MLTDCCLNLAPFLSAPLLPLPAGGVAGCELRQYAGRQRGQRGQHRSWQQVHHFQSAWLELPSSPAPALLLAVREPSSPAPEYSFPITSQVTHVLLAARGDPLCWSSLPSPLSCPGYRGKSMPGAWSGQWEEMLFLLSLPFNASSHQTAPVWGKGRRWSHLSGVDPELEFHSHQAITGSLLK